VASLKVEELGRDRGRGDGSRRYLPYAFTFDTRAMIFDMAAGTDIEPDVARVNVANQSRMRETLIHEFGASGYEQKVANFIDLGAAPWSVAALHNIYLEQVRQAFTLGAYYPALVGACALGERILNHLVLTLRDDYANHPATTHVTGKESFSGWEKCIRTLEEWGVITTDVKSEYRALETARHDAVHYRPKLDTGEARDAALHAIKLVGGAVEKLFHPHGSGPHYFSGPISRSYVKLVSERDPFIRRFILPACVLVSPRFRFVPSGVGFDVYDDPDYGVGQSAITDEQFALAGGTEKQVEYPF
jgi:hypothetical protein